MTSGNLSEEPIAYTNEDARERLSSLADTFLMHNRDIHVRCDDSVVRVIKNQVSVDQESQLSEYQIPNTKYQIPNLPPPPFTRLCPLSSKTTLGCPSAPRHRCGVEEYFLHHQSKLCFYEPSYWRFIQFWDFAIFRAGNRAFWETFSRKTRSNCLRFTPKLSLFPLCSIASGAEKKLRQRLHGFHR